MKIENKGAVWSAGLLLALGCVVLTGCERPQAAGEGPPMGPPEVGVVDIQPQKVALTTELAGRTAAYMVSEVRPQVGGIIQKRLFTEGGDVAAGQPLYQIDPATYQVAFESAKASRAKAEANLASTRSKASRYEELVAIKAVSQQDYDDAQAALKQGQADVAAAKAAVETARINLAYTKVASPIAGRIGRSTVTPSSARKGMPGIRSSGAPSGYAATMRRPGTGMSPPVAALSEAIVAMPPCE